MFFVCDLKICNSSSFKNSYEWYNELKYKNRSIRFFSSEEHIRRFDESQYIGSGGQKLETALRRSRMLES